MSIETYTRATDQDQAPNHRSMAMGIWIELGIFLLVLLFGLWQIHDVGQERRKRQAQKDAANPPAAAQPGDEQQK